MPDDFATCQQRGVAPFQRWAGQLAGSFGLQSDRLRRATSASELFTALSNEMVIAASGGTLGAQISNSDRTFMEQRFPQLAQSAPGRREIMDYLDRLGQRNIETERFANEYRRNNNNSMRGFNVAFADWVNDPRNQMFPSSNEPAAPAPAPPPAPSRAGETLPGGARVLRVRPSGTQ